MVMVRRSLGSGGQTKLGHTQRVRPEGLSSQTARRSRWVKKPHPQLLVITGATAHFGSNIFVTQDHLFVACSRCVARANPADAGRAVAETPDPHWQAPTRVDGYPNPRDSGLERG
jgi:hypothetical protein